MGLNSKNVYENHVKGKHPALHLKWSKKHIKTLFSRRFLFRGESNTKKKKQQGIFDYFLMFKYVLDFSWNKNTKTTIKFVLTKWRVT